MNWLPEGFVKDDVAALLGYLHERGYRSLTWTHVLDPTNGEVVLDEETVTAFHPGDNSDTMDVLDDETAPERLGDTLAHLAAACSPHTCGSGVFVLDAGTQTVCCTDTALGILGYYHAAPAIPQPTITVVC